jgi:hypothetical protein
MPFPLDTFGVVAPTGLEAGFAGDLALTGLEAFAGLEARPAGEAALSALAGLAALEAFVALHDSNAIRADSTAASSAEQLSMARLEVFEGETSTSLYPLSLVLTHELRASATACCSGVVSFFLPMFFPTQTSRSLTVILPPRRP